MIKVYDGQAYEMVEVVPYVRRDGGETLLNRWRSRCAACGEPFFFTAPAEATKFSPNRRCAKHKSPGRKVARQRPQRIKNDDVRVGNE